MADLEPPEAALLLAAKASSCPWCGGLGWRRVTELNGVPVYHWTPCRNCRAERLAAKRLSPAVGRLLDIIEGRGQSVSLVFGVRVWEGTDPIGRQA